MVHELLIAVVPLVNIPKILIAVYFTKCMYQLHSCGECIRIPDFHHLIWTLCDPIDCCLPGSTVHGILQARILAAAAAAKSLQLCPTPCDPIDGSPPGSPIPGILQARTLEWVAISFSNA